MTSESRVRRGAGWALWFAHQPLSSFWVILAGFVIAGVVALFTNPSHAVELFALAGTMAGGITLFAQIAGVAAWPRIHADGGREDEPSLAGSPREH